MKLQNASMAILGLATVLSMNVSALEGNYKLDPSHAKIGFEVPHMVISTVEGRFTKFEGTLTAGKKLTDLKVEASIDVTSVSTDDKDRNDHLQSPDFFDAAKYPKMTFVSTSVSGTEKKLKIKGKLTIKDVTKDVVLDGSVSKEVKDPWGNLRVAITGKTKINRQEFGLKFNKAAEAGPLVGDEVTISLSSEAIKQK
jgi:polyisoprenoid-binding protein YceI